MKKLSYVLLIFMLSFSLLFSDNVHNGELSADLNNDGKNEFVRWNSFGSNDQGEYYQLVVIDHNGSILYEGPKEKNSSNPYVFASLHYGISLPELLFDIDKDGHIELLAPEPQSDVSPTYYRRLKWQNNTFKKLSSRPLMMEGNKFVWKDGEQIYGTWISRFHGATKEGFIKADVTQYKSDGTWKSGTVLLNFITDGAMIRQWVKPLSGL